MSIKSLIIVVLVSISIISCNSNVHENEEYVSYVAIIDTTMTLSQIAKINNIGEPYLRTKLGVRQKIGKKYTITEMAKRFKFSIDDLRQIIEERKNKQALNKKKKAKAETGK